MFEIGRNRIRRVHVRPRKRGIGLPLLIRFPEILKARITELNEAFRNAITEYGYKGQYKGVYPIKVNQDRYVVEQIAAYGRPYHYGLEAGSKPEPSASPTSNGAGVHWPPW